MGANDTRVRPSLGPEEGVTRYSLTMDSLQNTAVKPMSVTRQHQPLDIVDRHRERNDAVIVRRKIWTDPATPAVDMVRWSVDRKRWLEDSYTSLHIRMVDERTYRQVNLNMRNHRQQLDVALYGH